MFKVKSTLSKDPLYQESEKLYYKKKPSDPVRALKKPVLVVDPDKKKKDTRRTVAQTRQTAPLGGPSKRLRSVKKTTTKSTTQKPRSRKTKKASKK
tara:strand:+ start:224 stop:511 length:288 start_codon:yes stop_codon:yes gene_type:complete